ncbi:MAG: DHA2 family efflux MFS transporter permease subunit [Pseudobdellovibrionaceae bacterium]
MKPENSPALNNENSMTFKDWLAVFGAILGAFMAILDIQITNASIRQITGGLGATIEDGSWISTSYLVAEIVIIPLSGWFARVLSLRKYLIWTSVLFLIFSVCCGFSWNLSSMIIFRSLQGLTGGALIPLAFQVMLMLPPSKRILGMSLFSITATFAPAIGPTVGGYLSEAFHWPVIFYINILPGILTLSTVLYAIKKEPGDSSLLKKIDVWGILTMAIGLASLTIFLEEGERKDWFSSNFIVFLAIVSLVFLALFIYIELKSDKAFIDLRLLLNRNFGLGCMVNFVIGLSMYGALFLLPMYLSTIQNYNSIYIGKTMMWAGLPQLMILPFVPKLLKRFDPRWVAFTGINIFAFSCFMNSEFTALVGIDQLKWSQIVRAVGQPLLMVPLSTITMGYINKEQAGSASGLFNMLRNLGGSVGIAILSTVLIKREHFHSERLGEGINIFKGATQYRMALLEKMFNSHGVDPVTAHQKSLAAIDMIIRKQAYVISFNDCFLAVSVGLVCSSVLILLCRKVTAKAGPSEAH